MNEKPLIHRVVYDQNTFNLTEGSTLDDVKLHLKDLFPDVYEKDVTIEDGVAYFREMYYWARKEYKQAPAYVIRNNEEGLLLMEAD